MQKTIDDYDFVISDDGSAFEASQFYEIMEIVDKPIMTLLLNDFKKDNLNNPIF